MTFPREFPVCERCNQPGILACYRERQYLLGNMREVAVAICVPCGLKSRLPRWFA